MSASQNFLFLNYLIEQSKRSVLFSNLNSQRLNALLKDMEEVKKLQLTLLPKLKNKINEDELKIEIQRIKAFIETVERDNPSSPLLANFQRNGLYKTLYHHPKIKGIDDQSILKTLLINGFYGLGFSALAMILFATLPATAPGWLSVVATSLFASAMTYVSAILYGVVNDIYATRANLPYFLLGHQPQQNSILRSNDPLVQGVAWGVAATFGPALIASIAFGAVTLVVGAFVPMATFVFPFTLIAMPLIAVGAEAYAKQRTQEYVDSGKMDETFIGSNSYQYLGLAIMSDDKKDKAAWLANSDRNLFGFTKVPLIGLGALAAMCGLSISHSWLPSILFSSTLNIVLPAATGMFGVLVLASLGVYTYVNRNKQIDNRYKLDFEFDGELGDTLYMDEELRSKFQKMDTQASLSELQDRLLILQPTQPTETPHASPRDVLHSQRAKRGAPPTAEDKNERRRKSFRI